MEKIFKHENDFEKILFPFLKEKNHDSSRGEGSKRGYGKKIFKGKDEIGIIKVKDIIFIVCCDKSGNEAKTCRIPWEKIKVKQEQKEYKGKFLFDCSFCFC